MKVTVVKYGGAAMKDEAAAREIMSGAVDLQKSGLRPLIVHGGGPEIERWLSRLEIPTRKVEGLRVTDAASMEIVEMALSGKVNKALVGMVQTAGGDAVGISGRDGGTFIASQRVVNGESLGFVGSITQTRTDLIEVLLEKNFIPVVSCIADNGSGRPMNVNGDEAAAALAIALHAETLVLLTDVPGVLRAWPDASSLIPRLTVDEAVALIDSGIIDGGMIPKLKSCIEVVRKGVGQVRILDGRDPAVLRGILREELASGTLIVP